MSSSEARRMVSSARARCRRERTVPMGQSRMAATVAYGSSSRSQSAMISRCCSGSSSMARRNAAVISRARDFVGGAGAVAGRMTTCRPRRVERNPAFLLAVVTADAMTQHAAQVGEHAALRGIERGSVRASARRRCRAPGLRPPGASGTSPRKSAAARGRVVRRAGAARPDRRRRAAPCSSRRRCSCFSWPRLCLHWATRARKVPCAGMCASPASDTTQARSTSTPMT